MWSRGSWRGIPHGPFVASFTLWYGLVGCVFPFVSAVWVPAPFSAVLLWLWFGHLVWRSAFRLNAIESLFLASQLVQILALCFLFKCMFSVKEPSLQAESATLEDEKSSLEG